MGAAYQQRSTHRTFGIEQLEPRLLMAGLVVNEFLASNTVGIQDEDGDRPDWIEFYNSGPDAVSLDGWSLTDDATVLDRWTFPAVDLPAGDYLLVFASGKNRSVAGQELHASFALNDLGEDLLLVMPDGVTVADAFLPYPQQAKDASYGRLGESLLGYMAAPTPGAANSEGAVGIVADTKFTVDRGFYDAPFNLGITSETIDATIRYTLDGSLPTMTTGVIYDPLSPPQISTTTIVRAAAFKADYLPTNVDTQTYIFLDDVIGQDGSGLPPYANWGWRGPDWRMDPDVVNNPLYAGTLIEDLKSVPTVSLVMPWDEWFGTGGEGIYIAGKNDERSGSVEFFTADGSEQWQIDSALEIQGGTSTNRWKMDKLSIRATFKQPFGPTKLNTDLFSNPLLDQGAANEFDTLIFDAQMNYTFAYGGGAAAVDQRSRAKLIQDQYVADLQNLTGGAAPHGRLANLYINGLYWGLYDLHERPDESFAASYLGGDKEDYDVIKHSDDGVVSGGDTAVDNYAAMLNVVRQNMSVPANYDAATQLVDVDELISYMIVNYYAGNTDWPHHNWYATFNRADPDGRWRFHSWDAEHVLKNLNYNAIFNGQFTGSPEELHQRLIANDEYRLRFNDLVQKHFFNEGVVTPSEAAATYMARMQEADRAIVAESARWGDSHTSGSEPAYYSHEDWVATQNDLLANYFPSRTGVVWDQFDSRGWLVSLAAPLFSQYGGAVSSGYELSMRRAPGSLRAASIFYTLDGSDPRDEESNAPGPSAHLYEGPITVDAGVRVQARLYHDVADADGIEKWSPSIDATFVLDSGFPLRIVELNYNPADFSGVVDEQDLEFFELLATGDQSISLDGVQIAEFADTPYQFPDGLTLMPGERMVVARAPASFELAYGANTSLVAAGYATANLSNGGERIVLLGPLGEVLQDFTYSDLAPWPSAPDGDGYTLEIIDPLGDPNDAANWRASYYFGGSPGSDGTPPETPADFNFDGRADGADFLAWQRGYGAPPLQGTIAMGDGDGDRDVDDADLDVWVQSFDAKSASPALLASNVLGDDGQLPRAAGAPSRLSVTVPAREELIDAALASFLLESRSEHETELLAHLGPSHAVPATAATMDQIAKITPKQRIEFSELPSRDRANRDDAFPDSENVIDGVLEELLSHWRMAR